MSFKELVKQSLKTKEQIEQEMQDEKTRLFNEQNEQAINYIVELIKKDILCQAETGKAKGNIISNTVFIPLHATYSDTLPDPPTVGIFKPKFEHKGNRSSHFFSYCDTAIKTLTIEDVNRLVLVFNAVKKRALQNNINTSDPFILVTVSDYNNNRDIKRTKKEFIHNNKLSAKVVTKTYSKGHKWKGESGSLSLAIDYSYTI